MAQPTPATVARVGAGSPTAPGERRLHLQPHLASTKRECLKVVEEGVASAEDVDRMWEIFTRADTPPLRLMDRVGLDIVLAIEEHYAAVRDGLPEGPRRLLRKYVDDGLIATVTATATTPRPITRPLPVDARISTAPSAATGTRRSDRSRETGAPGLLASSVASPTRLRKGV